MIETFEVESVKMRSVFKAKVGLGLLFICVIDLTFDVCLSFQPSNIRNAGDSTITSEEEDSTEEQKNKDESSVMVGNGSFSPSDHEVSDKDSEEVNEPVTQIEMETRESLDDTAVIY